jgi:phage terminase large subunit-like protein
MVITTTPQRLPLLRRIIARPSTILLRGTLDDNRRNLTEETLRELHDSYDGTDIGRQELEGILLDDVEGSLWRRPWIEEPRIRPQSTDTGGVLQALERVGVTLSQVVLAIDPSTTAGDRSDACGLVVAAEGNAPRGGAVDERRHYYVLEDLTARVSPAKWAHSAVQAYHRWGCGRVVAETTKGGEAIEALLHHHDDGIRVIRRGGSDGKILRAEPVAALYEQRRVHHVGSFADLETELTDYTQGARSPNRMDALVWAVRDLHEGRAAFSW